MGLKSESRAISGHWSQFVDGLKAPFDENVRKSTEAIKEAQAKVAKAQAKAESKALKAKTKLLVEKIKNGESIEPIVEKVKSSRFTRSAKAGFWVVEQPIAVAMKPVKWLTGAAAKHPYTAAIIAAGAAAVGIGNAMARNNASRLQAQADTLEAMAADPQPSYPMYKNNPEASQAFIDARIAQDRANGAAPSQTEMLAARQPIQAPEAAGAGPAV